MHHRPLLHIHRLTRRVRSAHRALQQIRRMGEGIFETQVVVQDEGRGILRAFICFLNGQ